MNKDDYCEHPLDWRAIKTFDNGYVVSQMEVCKKCLKVMKRFTRKSL
jgi:hypothetical protein